MRRKTDFLFSRPNFCGGMASCLDLGATLFKYDYSNNPAHTDYQALQSDWEVVGQDLKFSINLYRHHSESHGK